MNRPVEAHIPGATQTDQPLNPSRRAFMRRTAAVATATAIGLAVPGPVFSAVRDLQLESSLGSDARREPESEPELSADAVRESEPEPELSADAVREPQTKTPLTTDTGR